MDSYRNRSPSGRGDDSWVPGDETGRPPQGYGRRRSPDRRRSSGRGRSRSPQAVDRYQPGRNGRDDYQGRRDDPYRRRSPPPMPLPSIDRYVPGQESPALLVNPLMDPLKMDQQVGFSYFAEWWRRDHAIKEEREHQKQGIRRPPERVKGDKESREEREEERKQIQAAYDAYKVQLQAQSSKIFVQLHKDEEWFKERYDTDVRTPFRHRQADFRRGAYAQWEADLNSGVFDEFTLEGIYKSEANGAGGVIEKEEGETIAATEVLGVGDLLPTKGGDIRDPAADQPALLIKTIAPHVSRENLEAFCKEHIGEGEGGFQWLSLSDPNTQKKFHRIGWVMLNPGGDEVIQASNNDRDRDNGQDDEQEEGEDTRMAVEPVVQSGASKALAEINGKAISIQDKGDFVCHVGIHVPTTVTRKKALWDLFSAPERIERDLQLAMQLVARLDQELGENVSAGNQIEERVEEIRSQGLLQPQTNGSTKPPKPLREDGEDEDGEEEDEEEGAYDEETDDEDLLAKKKKLDLLIEYLRRVYNFCFFCVFECDSVHELQRKCPGGHLRRPRASLTSAAKAAARASVAGEPFPLKRQDSAPEPDNEDGSPVAEKRFNKNNKTHLQLQRAFTWVKTYEEKLLQILEADNVDLKKLGGRPLEEAVDEELKKFVKQEDEAKFRCKVPGCTKLFRGDSFWRKHVEKRHDDWYKNFRKDLDMINQYVLDPSHVVPSRVDPNSNGPFQGNGMQGGTPRGFSLSNIPFGFPMGMPPGGLPPPPGFPATFGQYPVTMPMPPYGPNYAMDPNSQVGPMRRGGGRFGNRTAGPYDRQPKDARNARWANPGGMEPPRAMRGGMMGPPPMRFADASGGATVGPREAVAGRSLKSYEDLDAIGAEVKEELNY